MTYSYNDTVPNYTITETFLDNSIIEIQFWEVHLNRSGHHAKFLVKYALDNEPVIGENLSQGRICYRFTKEVWFATIKIFLIQNRIPVSVRFEKLTQVPEVSGANRTYWF
jgi:hypothetical protein